MAFIEPPLIWKFQTHPSVDDNNTITSQVTMSYFELYNEMIRDLLNPSSGLLDLREDNKGRNVVAGLSEVEAASTEDIMAMLVQGNLERTQEPTAANLTSSRCGLIQ